MPDGEINWSDNLPHKSRSALTLEDLIPNQSDGEELHKRAVAYVMCFMVTKFLSERLQSDAELSGDPQVTACA